MNTASRRIRTACAAALVGIVSFSAAAPVAADPTAALSGTLEEIAYPYPVQYLPLEMESVDVKLAFMDVAAPSEPNGHTVVLIHGRNFFGAYWRETIERLSARGYRVVVPDQIGFGKSSKPDVPHSLHVHARNTVQLLDRLGVERAVVVGHSLGGMMAIRFARMFPERVERLVLEDPLGLEDYRIDVPFATRAELTTEARNQTRSAIDALFHGFFVRWREEYRLFADVQAAWLAGPDADRIARTAAHTYTMAYEQPVLYELPLIRIPTLLFAGEKDRTALGRNRVSPEIRAHLGLYPELSRKAAQAMPNAVLELIPDVGHVPHLEAPERFHQTLLRFLEGD